MPRCFHDNSLGASSHQVSSVQHAARGLGRRGRSHAEPMPRCLQAVLTTQTHEDSERPHDSWAVTSDDTEGSMMGLHFHANPKNTTSYHVSPWSRIKLHNQNVLSHKATLNHWNPHFKNPQEMSSIAATRIIVLRKGGPARRTSSCWRSSWKIYKKGGISRGMKWPWLEGPRFHHLTCN